MTYEEIPVTMTNDNKQWSNDRDNLVGNNENNVY